ncbi:DUF4817 domain-containing protein [Trichonephila clavipes]|nr:DUF4817 domain-containing protein [Trichonephila clavipes]
MMFSQEQGIAIVEFYFAIKSHCRVINAFQQKYLGEIAPNASTITILVQRFRDTGSVADRKRSGRASIVKTKVADVEITLQRSPFKRPYTWLQQDGATRHTSRDSMEVLTKFFDDHVISKGLWPPRLPD